jgi:hypothetical protein
VSDFSISIFHALDGLTIREIKVGNQVFLPASIKTMEEVRKELHPSSPVDTQNDEHGFWDETWSYFFGGYVDREAAQAACDRYAQYLEDGKDWQPDLGKKEKLTRDCICGAGRLNRGHTAECTNHRTPKPPMDPWAAARKFLSLINPELIDVAAPHPKGDGSRHMAWMVLEIVNTPMSIGKANRWLGWAQCLGMIYKHVTLEQCKEMNKEVS